jgi:hypothetical protein
MSKVVLPDADGDHEEETAGCVPGAAAREAGEDESEGGDVLAYGMEWDRKITFSDSDVANAGAKDS